MSVQFCVSAAEAGKKWCPFARVPDSNGGGQGVTATNRHAGKKKRPDGRESFLRSASMCIAGQCMAWRWVETHIHNPNNPKGDLIASGDTHGYCGLAGDPRTTVRAERST